MAFAAVWLTGDGVWISFNPMQQFFSFQMDVWMWAITGVSALGALLFFRFWCRYWCPLGAFFALGNKLAILDRFAAKRRFNRCDLGVDHAYDVDCIRCDRCVTELPAATSDRLELSRFHLLPVFMLAMALLIALHLFFALEKQSDRIGGWRKIDTQKVKTQIGSGRLNNTEAQWWREAMESEKIDGK